MRSNNMIIKVVAVFCILGVSGSTYSFVCPVWSLDKAGNKGPVKTERRSEKTAFISWERNPFAAQKIPGGPAVEVRLKGVVWYDNVPKAMLNDGVIVGVGDKVGSDVVTEITEDSITLKRGTQKYTVRLEY